jgi:multimeric flavodoxin WrbA
MSIVPTAQAPFRMSSRSIIILGSARSDGNTRKIVDWISEHTEIEVVDLNTLHIGYFDYAFSNREDDFLPLAEKLIQYDTWIFATPVYWYSMSAVMKTFFDRITDLLDLRKDLGDQIAGKNMMLIACSGHEDLQEWFSLPFIFTAKYLGMQFLGEVHAWLENKQVPVRAETALNRFIRQIPE